MKNRVLIIDHEIEICKEIKYSLASDTTEAYYCLTLLDGLAALDDKVRAFELGADDYLTKLFETEECLARAYAMLRRFTELNTLKTWAYSIVAYNDLVIKQEGRQVLLCGKPLHLTRREYDLLCLLASHPGRVYTFEQLYELIWPEEYIDGKNSVVCQIQRLRKKLTGTDFIEAVRDVGYRFKSE